MWDRRAFLTGGMRRLQGLFVNSNCLGNQKIVCRSCGDACEARAIRFKHDISATPLPVIDLDKCNYCAACISVCPTNAITMTASMRNKS